MEQNEEWTIKPDEQQFVITRVFDAPREQVFRAWADPERFARWWGPKGFAVRVAQMDVQPGGLCLCAMSAPGDGTPEMWGKFVYHEVCAPERLVFVSSFSDADGNTTRAFFSPEWSLEVLNVVTLTEQDSGGTMLVLRGKPIHATDAEKAAFFGSIESMQGGFSGTFDKLAEYLAIPSKEAYDA